MAIAYTLRFSMERKSRRGIVDKSVSRSNIQDSSCRDPTWNELLNFRAIIEVVGGTHSEKVQNTRLAFYTLASTEVRSRYEDITYS